MTPRLTGGGPFPCPVLAKVLTCVPQQERMRVCALVHSDWSAAARIATEHAAVSRVTAAKQAVLPTILLHARSLTLNGDRQHPRPVTLKALGSVRSLTVAFADFSDPPALDGLDSLELLECWIAMDSLCAAFPAHSTSLTKLVLHQRTLDPQTVNCGPLLQRLPQLKELDVDGFSMRDMTPPVLTALLSAELEMRVVKQDDLAGLSSAHSLQHLVVRYRGADPQWSVLQGLSELQLLHVAGGRAGGSSGAEGRVGGTHCRVGGHCFWTQSSCVCSHS